MISQPMKTAGKASFVAKQREKLQQAEALLRQKQAEHEAELLLRQQLLRRVTLLESVTNADDLGGLMQRMMLHTWPETDPTDPTALQQHGAAALHMQGPAPSTFQLEELPMSLADFDDQLLQRAADMTIEDFVRIYSTFVERTQLALGHVQCHGDQSFMKQGLTETVTRFSHLLLVHSVIHLRFVKRLLTLNCITWQEEEAPPGWYAQVAQLIPVHREFAAVVQAGIQCSHDLVGMASDSKDDVLKQVRHLAQGPNAQSSIGNAELLEALLDRMPRSTKSVILARTLVGISIFASMLRCFDVVVVGQALSSCWPYRIRMVAFEHYLNRADVQAVLQGQGQGQGQGQQDV